MTITFYLKEIIQNKKGSPLVEFALIAPVFILILNGLLQISILFYSNAGLDHGVAEASRQAIIYPTPDIATIEQTARDKSYGVKSSEFTTVTAVKGISSGTNYIEITAKIEKTPNFIFFNGGIVPMTATRRVFIPQ